jgi:hypothetical protein
MVDAWRQRQEVEYVATEPVDLRRGFDGLAAATRSINRADSMSATSSCS